MSVSLPKLEGPGVVDSDDDDDDDDDEQGADPERSEDKQGKPTGNLIIPRRKPGRGRPPTLGMPFEAKHPLSETHYAKLESKHGAPILAGAPPPKLSRFNDRRTRREFVRYYAALIIPYWEEEDNDEDDRGGVVCGTKSAEHYIDPSPPCQSSGWRTDAFSKL